MNEEQQNSESEKQELGDVEQEKQETNQTLLQDLHLQNKALLQFEKNVTKNKFAKDYLYNYPVEGKEYAVITLPNYQKFEIRYYFGRAICYNLLDVSNPTAISIFWCDTLRDINHYLNKLKYGKENDTVDT